MHHLSAFLSSKLLQSGAAIVCHTDGDELDATERRRGRVTNYSPNDLVCGIEFDDGARKGVNLGQVPFKISIPQGTPIQCDKLLGHEVEIFTDDVYYTAVVNQANTEVAANLLRFTNGDKKWLDMQTQQYKLVSSPNLPLDASLSLDDLDLPPDSVIEVDYDRKLDDIVIEEQVFIDPKSKEAWRSDTSLPAKPPPLSSSGGSSSGVPKGKSPKRKKHKSKSPKGRKSPKPVR